MEEVISFGKQHHGLSSMEEHVSSPRNFVHIGILTNLHEAHLFSFEIVTKSYEVEIRRNEDESVTETCVSTLRPEFVNKEVKSSVLHLHMIVARETFKNLWDLADYIHHRASVMCGSER